MFAFWRFLEIITLIPTLGMLAWFVHQYAGNNALTPNYVLVLFIVSVLAAAWAIATLFTYHRARSNAFFVSFVDLCFVGAFIGGVYELRGIAHANCSHVSRDHTYAGGINFGEFGTLGFSIHGLNVDVDKDCAMLKASFAFGIMNCIFFAITSFLAFIFGRRDAPARKDTYVRETHVTRTAHRRGSGSHHSHRSSHSGRRRAYV